MNIALCFTLFRLVASCSVLPIVLLFNLFSDPFHSSLFSCSIFMLLSLSDCLDGYLARKYNTVSRFGAFLDPVADKCLMITTLLCLLFLHRVPIFFVLVMSLRELLMASVRQYAAEQGMIIAVSPAGKAKTVFQSCALGFSIIAFDSLYYTLLKHVLLCVATFFSVFSFMLYINASKQIWKK